ncbi:hypothetical protein [Hymenobacter negativus]|uniref:T9SS type A sorting domain-containing protein n=1 Tax=Hymenobacter negativus TaxID=2795026 RepID=A0ABS3QIS1_9BACT|nr:hypothetical protein [Hymenobacter negativus]MBO2011144.1 hypothetical protein [Hymenobacter negativus]
MKKRLLLFTALCLGFADRLPLAAQSLSATFAAPRMYAPGTVYSALEQPDGKIVTTGIYTRVNGTSASGISRFNTNGTLDAAFQQNVGAAPVTYRVRLLSNGQFMLGYSPSAPFTVGGITRQSLLRLNANGTGDASFNIGTGPSYNGVTSYIDDYLPLSNGQLIAVGGFDQFNGAAVPGGIVRLTATGAVDPTFNSGGLGVNLYDDILSIVALPNGQYLIGGYITSYNGVPCNGLARINSDGSLDQTFTPALTAGSDADNIVVQPDGKILISGGLFFNSTGPQGQGIARLLSNGALDPNFTPPAALTSYSVYSYSGDAMQLQPDGKVLFINDPLYNGTSLPGVNRLNADGTLDTSFQVGTGPNIRPNALTLLASGQVLVAGTFGSFTGTLDRGLIELTSSGVINPAFQPTIQTDGTATAMVRQPDGKLLVGGNFSEINAQPVRRLARFNTDGTVDASFSPNVGLDLGVVDVALQPDGRILTATPAAVNRFLSNGSPDNSLNAPSFLASNVARLLLQPDGRILVGSLNVALAGNVTNALVRLLADGTRDASFTPATTGPRLTAFQTMALQPDGKILVAGTGIPVGSTNSSRGVLRLESNGATDASFLSGAFTNSGTTRLQALALQPDGKLLVGGAFLAIGGTARTNVARLTATGAVDASFVPPTITGTVNTLALQPNNRVLMGGLFTSPSIPSNLARLQSDGQADASYGASATPNGAVRALLIQPDGNIMAGGSFTAIAGQPIFGVARITASNVLHVAAPQAVADRTEAWPIPTHTILTVAPDASAHPQSLDLLDGLGRTLRHQVLSGSQPATLSVDALPVGIYLLRVNYAEGTVLRRVQVQ